MSKNHTDSDRGAGMRLFQIAAERELLNAKQIRHCREVYEDTLAAAAERGMGEVMVELGYLTPEQLVAVKKEDQRRRYRIRGYEILDKVGSGAVGSVYRARQVAMERDVALKILHASLATDPRVVEKYVSEARAVAKLNHPHIVQGIDVGESEGLYYFAMEYLSGGTFEKLLEEEGPLEEERALIYLYQVASALQHAWEKNIIHCDLKPANLMLDKEGRLKITDLGLARIGEGDSTDVGASDGKRVVRGTPHYLSPEQIETPDGLDCRTDIYSLGATFYHLVGGITPFAGSGNKEIILARLKGDPLPLNAAAPEVSAGLARLIGRMMSRKREDRPQTPGEVKKAVVDLGVDVGATGDLVGVVRKKKKPLVPPQFKKKTSRKSAAGSEPPRRISTGRRNAGNAKLWLAVGVAAAALLAVLAVLAMFAH